jgi:PfaD family protein
VERVGRGRPGGEPAQDAIRAALERLDTPFAVLEGGAVVAGEPRGPVRARVPALPPDRLGDPAFRAAYGARYAYATGSMANGIASVELVAEVARGGMLGFFGSAGLPTDRIRAAVDALGAQLGALPFGVNLIHSPAEPRQELETAALLVERGVRAVEASAFVQLGPSLVLLRAAGLRTRPDGTVAPARRIAAKVSRPEVAARFLSPAPAELLSALVAAGRITEDEARLAAALPMADDLTAEADSGGHTDNRPLVVLLPQLQALRDELCARHGYREPVRVGAAGGIGTPMAAAAAFALGAGYVMTGSVNQACVEAGTSPMVKRQLAEAGPADVTMAPSSDMFEQGVQVQVLKRGTLFPQRAAQLYEWYRSYDALDALPGPARERLEGQILCAPVATVWAECERYFAARDPAQLDRAARDPRHRMALVFRWYLGRSSRWAIDGAEDRRGDVQVWCGPVNRRVVTVGANLLAGAAAVTRARILAAQGVPVDLPAYGWRPRPIRPTPLPAEPQVEAHV